MQALTRPSLRLVVPILWLSGIAAGVWSLDSYQSISGQAEATPVRLPDMLAHPTRQTRPRLLMFVHPHCPCTRASLAELANILARCPDFVTAEVVLVKPAGVSAGWEQGIVSTAAAGLSRVLVRCDEDGEQARRYGAHTSGHVVLYGADGKLLFSGGITRSRGHTGENTGTRAIIAVLNGKPIESTATPVFGCPLFALQECQTTADPCVTKSDSHHISLPTLTGNSLP